MSSPRILVVDDEADIRGLLSEILVEEGYEVEVAADAASARRAAAREEPDLVLLDIWMPDMDGISLLREWNEKNTMRCPVVMLSGHGTVETAVEVLARELPGGIHDLAQAADEVVVAHHRRNRRREPRHRRDERLGDAGGDHDQRRRALRADVEERAHDPPHSAEQSDER